MYKIVLKVVFVLCSTKKDASHFETGEHEDKESTKKPIAGMVNRSLIAFRNNCLVDLDTIYLR